MVGTAENEEDLVLRDDELDSAMREVVRSLAERKAGGQNALSRSIGSAENRVNRFVNNERDLKVKELCRVVDSLGPSAVVFLELVRLKLRQPTSQEVMRYLGLPNGPADDPFLAEIEELAARGGDGDPGPRLEELKDLDDLRFAGAPAAQQRLEIVCRELTTGLCGPAADRSRHELALAAGLWATIARTTGKKEPAATAYALAFEVAGPKNGEAEAILRSRASYLLMDLGHSGFAFNFLNAAAEHYLITNDRERYGTCLVDRAIALIKQGELEKAEVALTNAVGLIPMAEWRYRVAAHHCLATCAEQRSLGLARGHLDHAIHEYGTRKDSTLGQFYWTRGRYDLAAGNLQSASQCFRQASSILSVFGQPFEGELTLLSVAEIAVQRRDATERRSLGREFLDSVPKNSFDRSAKEALIGVANCLLWNSNTAECLAAIESCRGKLLASGKHYLPAYTHR